MLCMGKPIRELTDTVDIPLSCVCTKSSPLLEPRCVSASAVQSAKLLNSFKYQSSIMSSVAQDTHYLVNDFV